MPNALSFFVAIGVSPVPTRYRAKMAGIWTFVRCGADILLSGLHSDLEGEARCPICAASIRFRIENRMVVDLRPPTALLHVVERPSSAGVIAIVCEETISSTTNRASANGSVVTRNRKAVSRRLKTIWRGVSLGEPVRIDEADCDFVSNPQVGLPGVPRRLSSPRDHFFALASS